MTLPRRAFLTTLAGGAALAQSADSRVTQGLKPMTGGVSPISDEERRARIEKARRLMGTHKIDAIFLEPGSSLYYYTGARIPVSADLAGLILPARGEPAWILPANDSRRDSLRFTNDVRTWTGSPYKTIAQAFKDRGVTSRRIGIEEQVRFSAYDGMRAESAGFDFVNAVDVTAGCRMYKTPAEIALMQRASDITIEALKAVFSNLREGMSSVDLRNDLSAAYKALGVQAGGLIGLGKFTAFPHGSIKPQALREGDVVLIDTGCQVEGYTSDITRTSVFGKPTDRQRQVWDLERKAQDAAFAAAKLDAPCESLDAAARNVITKAGFGPGYKVPGLPHRTGHGIGLDGHEWTNLVKGNKTPLAPGMCFSDEPTIVIYGEFGVRLEDCFYMTESGPKMFSKQSPAVDRPFA